LPGNPAGPDGKPCGQSHGFRSGSLRRQSGDGGRVEEAAGLSSKPDRELHGGSDRNRPGPVRCPSGYPAIRRATNDREIRGGVLAGPGQG